MKHAKNTRSLPKRTETKAELLRRIRRHSRADKETGCRIWSLFVTQTGRPIIRVNRTPVSARKIVYELHNGPVPEGYGVVATCRCAGCIEPKHLEAKPRNEILPWLMAAGLLSTAEVKSRKLVADSISAETRTAVRARILAIKERGARLTAAELEKIAADFGVSAHWARGFAHRGMPDRRNARTPEATRSAVRERITEIRTEVGDRASRSAAVLDSVAHEFGVGVKWIQKFIRSGMPVSRPVVIGASSVFRLGASMIDSRGAAA